MAFGYCKHGVMNRLSDRDARYCPKCHVETARSMVDHTRDRLKMYKEELVKAEDFVEEHNVPWTGTVWDCPDWLKGK